MDIMLQKCVLELKLYCLYPEEACRRLSPDIPMVFSGSGSARRKSGENACLTAGQIRKFTATNRHYLNGHDFFFFNCEDVVCFFYELVCKILYIDFGIALKVFGDI